MRTLSRAAGPILLALLLPTVPTSTAFAQSAVVMNNVNLRERPSVNDVKIRTLLPGDELTLIGPEKTNNYFNVRTSAGEVGRAYSPRIRVLDSASVASPDADSIPIVSTGARSKGRPPMPVGRLGTDSRTEGPRRRPQRLTAQSHSRESWRPATTRIVGPTAPERF